MPLNSLAPGYVKIYYDVTYDSLLVNHVLTLPLNITFLDGIDTICAKKDTTTQPWADCVTDFLYVAKALFSSNASVFGFTHADLYSMAGPSDPPIYEATLSIASTAGTSGTTGTHSAMSTLTFRSEKGGHGKIVLVETTDAINLRKAYAGMSSANQALATYLLGDTSAWYMRDNSYPAAFLWQTTKISDAIRKIRLGL